MEPLIAVLRDESSWDVRTAAAVALGNIGDVRAVEPLIKALGDKDSGVRIAAAESLVKLHRSGQLDSRSKERILAMRRTMAEPHHSYTSSDCSSHTDTGIGVSL